MAARRVWLFSIMVIAAVSVIILSMIGIAAMTGHIPPAQSQQKAELDNAAVAQPATRRNEVRQWTAQTGSCSTCGVVESIRVKNQRSGGNGPGAAVGGAIGGPPGERTRDGIIVPPMPGAGDGVYAADDVGRGVRNTTRYVIRVRMEDGTYSTVYNQRYPSVNVGERVKVKDGVIVKLSVGTIVALRRDPACARIA